jgi:hypothetical protein
MVNESDQERENDPEESVSNLATPSPRVYKAACQLWLRTDVCFRIALFFDAVIYSGTGYFDTGK